MIFSGSYMLIDCIIRHHFSVGPMHHRRSDSLSYGSFSMLIQFSRQGRRRKQFICIAHAHRTILEKYSWVKMGASTRCKFRMNSLLVFGLRANVDLTLFPYTDLSSLIYFSSSVRRPQSHHSQITCIVQQPDVKQPALKT